MQHVGRFSYASWDSSAIKFDRVEIAFTLALLYWLIHERINEGRKPEYPEKPLTTSFRKCHILKPQPGLEPAL